jgi:hypothetical protein
VKLGTLALGAAWMADGLGHLDRDPVKEGEDKMRNVLIAAAATLASFATPADADEITDRTPCSVAVRAFDNKEMDMVRETGLFILNTMQDLDDRHADAGEPGIMAQMIDHARGNAVAAAVGFCRQHPKATIYSQAADAYDGLRSISIELGVAK